MTWTGLLKKLRATVPKTGVDLNVPNLSLSFPADKWTIVAIAALFSLTAMVCTYLIFVRASVENVESVMQRFSDKPEKASPARIEMLEFKEDQIMAPRPTLSNRLDGSVSE
jgi:hypothetical protein